MSIFKKGERVRIVDSSDSVDTYLIESIKRSKDERPLYLLRSERDGLLRLYREGWETLLERIDSKESTHWYS